MVQLIPVFLMGVFGVSVLLLLKRFNVRWAIFLLTIGLFIIFSYASAAPDWRITISNVVSMAVLFFVPLAAVFYMPKLLNKSIVANLATLVVGGVTTLTFQYVGLGLAVVLGVK
ncbi:hypothetical protein [Shewanella woodyi]|uniref:hypothetical protein n=1 Tax=Shewanella woodyi TaxID=60961 RepID=UPI003748D31E